MHQIHQPAHPRIRVTEAELDRQILAFFERIRIDNGEVRDWIPTVLASKTKDSQAETKSQRAELQRQESLLERQQDRLLNLRIDDQIDDSTLAKKHTEIRDRIAAIRLHLDVFNRTKDEDADLTIKVIELSQTFQERWATADFDVNRRIREIIWLNSQLVGETLAPTTRKPFDVLAEGLIFEKMEDRGLEPLQNPREFEAFSESGTKSGTIGAWLAQCPIDDARLKAAIEKAVLNLVGNADQDIAKSEAAGIAPKCTPPTKRRLSRQSNKLP